MKLSPWFRETALGQVICYFVPGQYDHEGTGEVHSHLFERKDPLEGTESEESNETTPRAASGDNPNIVSWRGPNDPDHPQNWSLPVKLWITAILCIYSFIVYCGSSICIMSYGVIAMRYGKSTEVASLTLALYVLGYGMGPLLWSPLSEMPKFGRNPPYLISFAVFFFVSLGLCFADTFAGIVVLRFLQGFFGSPCLATTGASFQDIFSAEYHPYAMATWILWLFIGPAVGPLFASYAVTIDWRWPWWQIVWMAAPVLVALLFLPETSHDTILVHKAGHIRRHSSGDDDDDAKAGKSRNVLAPGELDTNTLRSRLAESLSKPLEISIKDPALAFVAVYTSFVYAIYYSYFEAFPRLYIIGYGMSAHSFSLTFLALVVGGLIGCSAHAVYLVLSRPTRTRNPPPEHEWYLIPAIPGTIGLSIGLFFFAGAAKTSPSIHWAVPTAGIVVFALSIFQVFQCLMVYLPLSYPRYAASLLAANDFTRSATAAVFVMVTPYMYENLGVGNGVLILASVSVIGIVGMVVLYFLGGSLRARSRFTAS